MKIISGSQEQVTLERLIGQFCESDDMATYDPYDIWKTKIGIKIKNLFYTNPVLGGMPAMIFSFWDLFINNSWRLGYKKQEFPIVRALAAKVLLNIYEFSGDVNYLHWAEHHFDWLIENNSRGYSGYCWGANMDWASKNGVYPSNTPFIAITAYMLEGLIMYQKITKSTNYHGIIISIYDFINKDLIKQIDYADLLSVSYSPIDEPRTVINANAYTLYSLSLLHSYLPEKKEDIQNDALRLFRFISGKQYSDGSWWYYADNKNGNFIDCFHTCFILKNLIKANNCISLPDSLNQVVENGYNYLLKNFYNTNSGLFRRFSKKDKLNLIKYDLYDNAEMLNLAYLMKDNQLFDSLGTSIKKHFIRGNHIFSRIDLFNCRRNEDMLRWAVMPYIFALSHLNKMHDS